MRTLRKHGPSRISLRIYSYSLTFRISSFKFPNLDSRVLNLRRIICTRYSRNINDSGNNLREKNYQHILPKLDMHGVLDAIYVHRLHTKFHRVVLATVGWTYFKI